MPNCVPIDEDGMRQPLHAKITNRDVLNWQQIDKPSIYRVPTFQNEEFISEFNNFNSPEDLKISACDSIDNHRIQLVLGCLTFELKLASVSSGLQPLILCNYLARIHACINITYRATGLCCPAAITSRCA